MSGAPDSFKHEGLVQIAVSELAIGMYVRRLDRPWQDTPYQVQGFYIYNESDIRNLARHCRHVYIDPAQSRWTPKDLQQIAESPEPSPESGQLSRRYPQQVKIENELKHAFDLMEDCGRFSQSMLESLRYSSRIDLPRLKELMGHCVKSIVHNPCALMFTCQVQDPARYDIEHGFRVAIYAMATGRYLDLDEDDLMELGLCGMLHDVGKVKVPPAISQKETALEYEEFEVMKNHALYGRQILMANYQMPESVIEAAYSHHERMDGDGYPRSLKSKRITRFTRIIAIADAFDAINAERSYRAGMPSHQALRVIFGSRGEQFDEALVEQFIKAIGVYPPGSLVEMSNHEVGVVLSSDDSYRMHPKIMLLLNSDKRLMRERIINLRTGACDPHGVPYRIKTLLANAEFGIDLSMYQFKDLPKESKRW